MKNIRLNNNYSIPQIGFGTFKIDKEKAAQVVETALKNGYTQIDCASAYNNQIEVGKGIKQSGVKREDIFITSKVWNSDQGYENTLKAFEKTCKELQVDYLDLYMIHWPKDIMSTLATYKALETLYEQKKIRAIGLCNFTLHQINEILPHISYLPQINQIELHPQFPQTKTLSYCKKLNIQITAWGSLMQGKIFEDEIVQEIASRKKCQVSQVALSWALNQNIVVIPKSTDKERMIDNLSSSKIILSDSDMEQLNELDNAKRIGSDPLERK